MPVVQAAEEEADVEIMPWKFLEGDAARTSLPQELQSPALSVSRGGARGQQVRENTVLLVQRPLAPPGPPCGVSLGLAAAQLGGGF